MYNSYTREITIVQLDVPINVRRPDWDPNPHAGIPPPEVHKY